MNGQLLSEPAHFDKASHNLASERSGNAKSGIPVKSTAQLYQEFDIALMCSSV